MNTSNDTVIQRMAAGLLALLFSVAQPALALNAGDAVTADIILGQDLVTGEFGHGLTVAADNITIDGNGHSLVFPVRSRWAGVGIEVGGHHNVTIKNFSKISGFLYGISASGGGALAIQNCRVESNQMGGINLINLSGVRVTGCVLREDSAGLAIYNCSQAVISGNSVIGGRAGIRVTQATGTESFTNNSFPHQLNDCSYPAYLRRMLAFKTMRRRANVGEVIDFSIALSALKGGQAGSSNCSVRTIPQEPVTFGRSGDTVSGSFRPTRNGLYSVIAEVTDPDGNTSMRSAKAFIGPAASREVTYYMYGGDDGSYHGMAAPGMPDEAGMNLVPPAFPGEFNCGIWVTWSPDSLPPTPTAFLRRLEVKALLQFDGAQLPSPWMGIQRVGDSGDLADVKTALPVAWGTKKIEWGETGLTGLGWLLDYPQDWYFLSMKFIARQPHIYTGNPLDWGHPADRISRTVFHYEVPTWPEIRSVSDPRLLVLGATADPLVAGGEKLTVWGWGGGQADLVLTNFQRPFLETPALIGATAETRFNSGSVNGERTFSSVPLDIRPSQNAVSVQVTAWPASGEGPRAWSESAAGAPGIVSHTVYRLSAGKSYRILANGIEWMTGVATPAGEFPFSYAGSFPVTFAVDQVQLNRPPVIVSLPAATPNPAMAGQSIAFAASAGDPDGDPLTYLWAFGDGTNGSGAAPAHVYSAAGSFTAQVTVSDGKGGLVSGAVVVTVNAIPVAPSITAQPANATVTAGQTASFSVVATGTAPLSHQWRKNGANIAGATSASYTTPATTAADNGALFSVVVTNSAGSAASSNATLTVNSSSGLVAHWKLDETSGLTAADATGNGYTGTLKNTASWTASGKINGALQLNGASDMSLNSSKVVPLGAAWTICGWFTAPLPNTGTWHTLTRSQVNDHHIITDSGLNLGMYDNATGGQFRWCGGNLGGLAAGWHHVAATGSGTTTKFYVDGLFVGSSDRKAASSDVYAVGNYQGGGQRFADKIDDVRIYNYALSAAEIAALYGSAPARYTLTLIKNGTGTGTVALSPAGGSCPSGTVVTLTAAPSAGAAFAGWSGDLAGTTNPATLTMSANKAVTATFNETSPPTVDVTSIVLKGAVDGTGSAVAFVTVNGLAATVAGNSWSLEVPLAAGSNTFTIVAKDQSGNQTSKTVTVTK